MGRNILLKNKQTTTKMSFFTSLPTFNVFDDFAPARRQNTRCCNDQYCSNNYSRNNVRKAQPQRRDPFDEMFNGSFGSNFNNSSFFDNGFNSQFFDDEYDTSYPNRRVKTARKPRTTQTRASQKTANKNCYEPKENLKRSTFVPHENQENIDPRFSQNEPRQTPKFYKSSFQSNTVNNNGNRTTITKKHYRDNDNSDINITEIKEDRDGNRNVRKISPENYSAEVKALMEKMEETGAVLMEIPSDENKSDTDSVKMLEENKDSKGSIDFSKISNTETGNNMF